MEIMPVKAIQQIMLGKVLESEKKARETLKLMKEAGYDGIELCGYMIRKVPAVVKILTGMAGMPVGKGAVLDWKSLLNEAGIQVVGIHEDLGTAARDKDFVIREAKEFKSKYIVISGMYRFDFSDPKAVSDLAGRLNSVGKELQKEGIGLLYHNHNAELTKVGRDKTAYRLLTEETDPELVGFEFDSYWPTDAGADAISMMQELGKRLKLYHINDRGSRGKGASLTPIKKSDSMELGYGNMNLKAIIGCALKADVDAVILESHRNWADKSPVKSFQLSAEFMNRYVR